MPPVTLSALLDATAANCPDAPAFGALSWAEAAERVRHLAGGLGTIGIGPGDRVAIFLPNRAEFLTLLFALARRGATAVLLNTRFRTAELAPLLTRAKPCAIALARDFAPVNASTVLESLPAAARASLRCAIAADGLPPGTLAGRPVHTLRGLRGGNAADLATPESEALTFTTSGTTAGPKLVLHRQRSLAVHAATLASRLALAPGAAALVPVPLCGTFGLTLALAALAGGAAIHAPERFDAAEADATIRRARVTHLVGGDDLLLRLAAAAAVCPYDSLRFTGFADFHGGAARLMAASSHLNLAARGVYGSSEAQALFALQDPSGPHAATGGGRPAHPDAAFAIAGDGGLLLRGPSLFDRYLGDDAATARARTAEGWFRTGDLAAAQPDGGFAFATRAGDALRLGGFLVSPEEIEGFLRTQPGVRAAAVIAEEGRAVACVVPGEGFDADRLLAACGAGLARFKVPARVVTLDALPVTDGPNGPKVQRGRLRDLIPLPSREGAGGGGGADPPSPALPRHPDPPPRGGREGTA